MTNPTEVLKSLSVKCQKESYKVNRIYRMLYNPEIYWIAYNNIYANNGNVTPGTDGATLDGMSDSRINKIIQSLKDGSYKPKPARRTYIEKKNGKLRPLGIQSGNDKLVEEAVKMILEAIYEPTFSDKSHGFRPGKSCHTALKQIQTTFKSINWFIEGDIKACFDSFDHHTIVEILRRRIEDDKFIQLIWKMLKAGYMEQWEFKPTMCGVPQGSGVSPILCNIYLNDLDRYIDQISSQWASKCERRPGNKDYRNITGEINRFIRKGNEDWNTLSPEEKRAHAKKVRDLRAKRQEYRSQGYDEQFVRIQYCRYADDFLLGIIGSKKVAETIKAEIKQFLSEKLHLTMSDEKTKITHSTKRALFLGFEITATADKSTKRPKWHDKPANGTNVAKKGRRQVKGCSPNRAPPRKSQSGQIKLLIPRERWVKKLTDTGAIIVKQNKLGKTIFWAMHRGELSSLPDISILWRYNAEIRGLYNYYCIANNVGVLLKYHSLMKYSFKKTLAYKYRTNVKEIMKRYTKDGTLTVIYDTKREQGKRATLYNGPFTRVHKAPMGPDRGMETEIQKWRKPNSIKERMKTKRCELCGKMSKRLEIHLVKKLKDLKGSQPWELVMIDMHRKTLIVCPDCHTTIHQNDK